MNQNSFDNIDDLLRKPYWIIDILPKQVPSNSEGQYFAIEQDKLFAKDTHGGFHGDGSSLYAFQYTDSSMEPEMEESELWRPLPFSDAVSDLINNSIGDESALWSRSSINSTVSIYDADEDIMYVLIKDT